MEYQDKVIFITGAGSGIGRAAAIAFANEGATIAVADINEVNGKQTTQEIGGDAGFFKCDVSSYDSVKSTIENVVKRYGKLDIGINNAGIGLPYDKTDAVKKEDWDRVMAINTSGVFYCMKYELQQMLKQGSGVILNTASIAGLRALPNNMPYVASKHAVVGMTKTAAAEYAKQNIRINAICPVFTVTPLFNPAQIEKAIPGLSNKLMQGIPMKRFSTAEEMADVILYLCSDRASFITGHAMPVDGGLTA